MTGPRPPASAFPARAGASLKPGHYDTILEERPDIGWFEVHAENYMGAGGLPHRYLEAVRTDYPVSLHGVGLSIGGQEPLDTAHLERLKQLNERYAPALFSEHLAWSSFGGRFFNDLLPVPYNEEALERCCDHVDQVQETLGREILLENPATYIAFTDSSMSEIDFLRAVASRCGCGLLLDINNVYVSAINHGFAPKDYLDAFPVERIEEIHLAGHSVDRDDEGAPLLIDAHDRSVDDAVWTLYRRVIARSGPLATLIEWDNDVPPWGELFGEARKAERILEARLSEPDHAVAR